MEEQLVPQGRGPRRSRAAFDRELTLVEGAVTLVASGAAPSVTLSGLSGGPRLARLALDLGSRAGVVVHAWRHPAATDPTDQRLDLTVEHG